MRKGDTLVVSKLDRLARSVPDARHIADELVARGVTLALGSSRNNPADPMGKMFFNILATFAEFEANLIRLRMREGMAIARAKGKLRGSSPSSPPNNSRSSRKCTGRDGIRSITWRSSSPSRDRPSTAPWPVAPDESHCRGESQAVTRSLERPPYKVSAIAALCVPPDRNQVRMYFRLYSDANIQGGAAIAFLQALKRHLGTVCLVWEIICRLIGHV